MGQCHFPANSYNVGGRFMHACRSLLALLQLLLSAAGLHTLSSQADSLGFVVLGIEAQYEDPDSSGWRVAELPELRTTWLSPCVATC